jgi:two-component system, sensor histidine kinase PdtaS
MLNVIKGFFTPKKMYENDIFERTKYLISYRLTLFLSIALIILSLVLFTYFSLPHGIFTFIGFLICFLSFIYIRITGRYKEFILIFNIIGSLLCIATLYYVKDLPRIVDGLWMIISFTFTFLTLGKKWGTIITLANGLALTIFFLFFYNEQIRLIQTMNQGQIYAFAFNIAICFIILYYFNWQSMKTNEEAQNQLKEAHLFLENQFDLINKQNNEKTILLKEVHHRVKNNLQVIVSLLRLQVREIKDQKEISKFNESINRVITMSMIHEKIYQSEELSSVNIEDYFKSLAENLISTYQVNYSIQFRINSKVQSLGLKPIVPLALIFNELFSNSLKYAFDQVEEPHIQVSLKQLSENEFEFDFKDNGVWKNT